jgi:hypothetical protein
MQVCRRFGERAWRRQSAQLLAASALIASLGCSGAANHSAPPPACRSNAACSPAQYCAFAPGSCGAGLGTCRDKPRACSEAYAPVCGCDGEVYPNACSAHAARVDLDVRRGCRRVIPDYLPCGAHYCDARRSYCEIYLSDVAELPSEHSCRALPEACLPGPAAPSCDCFPAGTPCLAFCGPLPSGGTLGFHLTCQGVKPPG